MTNKKTYKGRFSPKFPHKYKGDPTNIIYRSLWERKVMQYFDENSNVLEWQSEELYVPYLSPVDNKMHRYFPDFVFTAKTKNGTIETFMVEVKPFKQTQEPKPQKQKTQRFLQEVTTWGVNSSKWDAAKKYCEAQGWKFKLITEKQLGLL